MSDSYRELRRVTVGLTADTVAIAIIVWRVVYLLVAALAPVVVSVSEHPRYPDILVSRGGIDRYDRRG
jgi:hypothetical protein